MKKREIILRSRKKLELADCYRLFLRVSNLNVRTSIRLSDTELELVVKVWLKDNLIDRDEFRQELGLKSVADLNNRLSKLVNKGYLESRGKGVLRVANAWRLPLNIEVLKLGLVIDVIKGESEAADIE